MPIVRCQASLTNDSGLAEDACVNTWHYFGNADATAAGLFNDRLEDLYTTIQNWLSQSLTGGVVTKFYDVTVLPSGPPFHTDSFTITPGTSGPLPEEVALCLSYQALQTPGLDQRNRRGRVYIGPFGTNALATGAPARPHGTLITDLAGAATALASGAASDGTPWVVYSSTLASSALVTDGWVDNAWDTQRRRGKAASSRTTWT